MQINEFSRGVMFRHGDRSFTVTDVADGGDFLLIGVRADEVCQGETPVLVIDKDQLHTLITIPMLRIG